jgi:dienelactone hydrolase
VGTSTIDELRYGRRAPAWYLALSLCTVVVLSLPSCSAPDIAARPGPEQKVHVNGRTILMQRLAVPFSSDGSTIMLEGMLYRDAGLTSWRGIVMTHGRDGPSPKREPREVYNYHHLNKALAARGHAVLFLVRRGYGGSGGEDSEFLPTPVECALEAARDLAAGVEYLKSIPGVQERGIIVMGHSQGGWAAIAASTMALGGVVATVNLSGGINYATMGSGKITDVVQEDWIQSCAELGTKARLPMIWIYSENDRNHPPDRVTSSFDAYVNAGGIATLHILPPFMDNGHRIASAPELFLDLLFEDVAALEPAPE